MGKCRDNKEDVIGFRYGFLGVFSYYGWFGFYEVFVFIVILDIIVISKLEFNLIVYFFVLLE